jgi:hypothetical protein
MSKSFYNTLDLSGAALSKANARAATQEQFVAALFRQNPTVRFSPSQIQKLAAAKYGKTAPLTSWRRSVTNLCQRGTLTKCAKAYQIPGPFGLPENVWVYNAEGDTKALQSFLVFQQNGKLEDRPTVSQHPSAAPIPMHCEPKGFVQLQMFL